MILAIRRHGQYSAEFNEYSLMSFVHFGFISSAFIEAEKKALSLATSIDIAKHGKSLVKNFFLE
jgi:hypothetical protein